MKLLLKFIYLGKCEVSHYDLLTSWLLAKNLWSKVLLKRREILIRLVKRKIAKAKPEQNPIKAEILNPYTDVDNVDTNNISSILELDQSVQICAADHLGIYSTCFAEM